MFRDFKEAVARQFELMRGSQLYRTDVEKEVLWLTYLESFPPGSNPTVRERTEHDCSACRSFIKAVGSMVVIIDSQMVSLWDCEVGEPYTPVAAALSELVKSAPIKNILLHDQKKAGVDKNHETTDNGVLTWEHFYLELPDECVRADRGTIYGEKRSTMEVFRRALEEISTDAVETVVELIDQGSLYRGEEHLAPVQAFSKQKRLYEGIDDGTKMSFFVWRQDLSPAVTRIRNTAIGTLLVDLSDGEGLDSAVRKFEAKVAPANYRRPKTLVTKAMVEKARKKVEELGFGEALSRRFAVVEDVTVDNVIFADRSARKAMGADVFDEMIEEVRVSPKSLEKVEEIHIEEFVDKIVPKASRIELLFENKHQGNLVNLVAPVDPAAPSLFKWDNGFSWAYNGDVADSIRQKVKSAGGSVTGEFRASLAWWNTDDLDLHLVEPGPQGGMYSSFHIYYKDKQSPSGGTLDVDMNAVGKMSTEPVENITYARRNMMPEGTYHLFVNQFAKRNHQNGGFVVELEFDGELMKFAYEPHLRQCQNVTVAKFHYTHKEGLRIIEGLEREDASREIWGIKTQTFHPVSLMMLSPNHWNGSRPTGNRHYFFMLQGCQREGSSRGFFNEYLSDDLREHRKVFEMVGSKMRTEEEGPQLSGLGFSSTQRNHVFAKVSGAFTRTVKITF